MSELNFIPFYDKATVDAWKASMPDLSALLDFRPLPRRYKSNWRILHIDGFEASKMVFFSFDWANKVGERTFDGVHDWQNVGEMQ